MALRDRIPLKLAQEGPGKAKGREKTQVDVFRGSEYPPPLTLSILRAGGAVPQRRPSYLEAPRNGLNEISFASSRLPNGVLLPSVLRQARRPPQSPSGISASPSLYPCCS